MPAVQHPLELCIRHGIMCGSKNEFVILCSPNDILCSPNLVHSEVNLAQLLSTLQKGFVFEANKNGW